MIQKRCKRCYQLYTDRSSDYCTTKCALSDYSNFEKYADA